MSKKVFDQHTQRLALTLLFSGCVFAILLAAVLFTVGLTSFLVSAGVIGGPWVEIDDIYTLIWMMALISLILGGALAFFFGRVLMKPINVTINAMNSLAAGRFDTRIRFGPVISRHPTVRELTESFNTMASELEGTELLRSDFINSFSHEFKTPIVSVAGFAKLLKSDGLRPEERNEYLDIIESESIRLSNMAENILDLTRLENQIILTDVTSFNLSEQLRGCVLMLEHKWSEKELTPDIELDELCIEGSQRLLEQVWINLIDNAVKFSPPGGVLSVRAYAVDSAVQVTVENTGHIPAESLGRVFNKFYQADKSRAAAGNGIGLAVVKRILELHSGEVTAENGEGTVRFTVTLPGRQS